MPPKPKSFLRKAHGAGAAALVRIETPPANELSLPSASSSDTDVRDRDHNGRFLPQNTVARSSKIRPAKHGALVALEAKADPAWQTADRWGKRYAAHRRGEIAKAHGAISGGASTLIESAGCVLADSRYIRAKGAQAGDPALLKLAASLAETAKQLELSAWELAAREAPKNKVTDRPWFVQPKDPK